MNCWAVVPVKTLSAAKSRLAPALSLRRRKAMVCLLLRRTLGILNSTDGIAGILVAGKDRTVRAIARGAGAVFVPEDRRGGLNRALARAAAEAERRGADALIVLPADLPLLTAGDLSWTVNKIRRAPYLAVAPDHTGHGTNLIVVSPPRLIRFSFGHRSFHRHVQAARRAGVQATILLRRSLARDLDRPEDLERMGGLDRGGKEGPQGAGKPPMENEIRR
jgi:2-phospho-L-lactate guanylyltransferase